MNRADLSKHLNQLLPSKISQEKEDLLAHAGDLWPRKMLQARLHQKTELPLAVVRPTSTEDVQKLIKWANKEKLPIIPYGGGSGVCGAIQATPDSIALDLRKLNAVKEIDENSLTVSAQAGIMGPDLEDALNKKGFTLCHFPASFHISTLGGWISTRAAGQFSTAFGSIEDLLIALNVVLPNGERLETKVTPRSAAGPSLKELFLGAEGSLGVITEATCAIQRLPEQRSFMSYAFESLDKALETIQGLIQKGIRPAVIRLYDDLDTQMAASEMGIEIQKGNLLVVMFQGDKEVIAPHVKLTDTLFSAQGKTLGETPAKHWWEHRFALNDKKMTQILSQEGMILDTIEVATTWRHLKTLYDQVKQAIQADVTVMAHFSHFYHTGASIYFTFIGNVDEKQAIQKYDDIWNKAMTACLNAHGTISHHHGIGLLKKEWLARELGYGAELFLKIKNAIDPNHILNPK